MRSGLTANLLPCTRYSWKASLTYAQRFLPLKRSEEHTSELQSQSNLVCRLLLEKKKISVLEGVSTDAVGARGARQLARGHSSLFEYIGSGTHYRFFYGVVLVVTVCITHCVLRHA